MRQVFVADCGCKALNFDSQYAAESHEVSCLDKTAGKYVRGLVDSRLSVTDDPYYVAFRKAFFLTLGALYDLDTGKMKEDWRREWQTFPIPPKEYDPNS